MTPEELAEIEAKELANLKDRVNAGKSLTARQHARLQAATGSAATAPDSAFVSKWDDLADALKLSRRTILNHKSDPGAPRPRADGRHEVAAWQAFIREAGITSSAEPATDWKKEAERLKCELLQFDLDRKKNLSVPAAEVEQVQNRVFAALRQAIDAQPHRLAPKLIGQRDFNEIVAILEEGNVQLLKCLARAGDGLEEDATPA